MFIILLILVQFVLSDMQLAGLDLYYNGISGSLHICDENYTECISFANKINHMKNVTFVGVRPPDETHECILDDNKYDGKYMSFCIDAREQIIKETIKFSYNFSHSVYDGCNLCYGNYSSYWLLLLMSK